VITDAVLSRLEASQDVLQRRCYQEVLLLQTKLFALEELKCNKHMYYGCEN